MDGYIIEKARVGAKSVGVNTNYKGCTSKENHPTIAHTNTKAVRGYEYCRLKPLIL